MEMKKIKEILSRRSSYIFSDYAEYLDGDNAFVIREDSGFLPDIKECSKNAIRRAFGFNVGQGVQYSTTFDFETNEVFEETNVINRRVSLLGHFDSVSKRKEKVIPFEKYTKTERLDYAKKRFAELKA